MFKNDFYLYAATIKKVSTKKKDYHKVVPSTYEAILTKLRNRGMEFNNVNYELDSQGLLHIHCFVSIPTNAYIKKMLLGTKGYHILFEEIYDAAGWLKYCEKDKARGKVECNQEDDENPDDVSTDDDSYIDETPCHMVLTKRVV